MFAPFLILIVLDIGSRGRIFGFVDSSCCSFFDNELTIYEGRTITELRIDVDKWMFFELVSTMKKLDYREIDRIWYKDPTCGMNVLADDKGALDI